MRHAVEQGDEADEAFGGTNPRAASGARPEVPPNARAVAVGRGHRFAAYPRCWAAVGQRDVGTVGYHGHPVGIVTMVHEAQKTEFDIRSVGGEAYRRWCLAFWATSAAACGGVVWTMSHPDRHPWVFGASVTWFLGLLAGMLTRGVFLRMDPRRFALSAWERDGRVYDRVGVDAFAWLLQRTPLGWVDPFLKVRSGRGDMERLLRELSFAEGSHLVQGLASLALALAFLAGGQAVVAFAFVVLAIPLHIYPIMLQRRNRGRVMRVASRCERRRPTRG